jgi:hypothetical protein
MSNHNGQPQPCVAPGEHRGGEASIDITRHGAWLRVDPPSPATPFWTDHADGSRLGFQDLIADNQPDQIRTLSLAHAQGIAGLIETAFKSRDHGDDARARELFHRAGRLCTEPLGLWPTN